MNNEQILRRFFAAENQRDWAAYQTFLHPAVRWQLQKDGTYIFSGIDEYMAAIKKAYENNAIRFSCTGMMVSGDGNRIVAHLVNDHGIRSVDIFDFRDGKIYREFEFIMD
ncbi:MAG: nuclear transport factor 2 family protein [Cardiobacteriaceae bacterium]|nr:nuclear transport factor 2 family protein [Cardiobacteriaceae bacterium]